MEHCLKGLKSYFLGDLGIDSPAVLSYHGKIGYQKQLVGLREQWLSL